MTGETIINDKRYNLSVFKITDDEALDRMEKDFRKMNESFEHMPYAKNTLYKEIVKNIVYDKDGTWKNVLFYTVSIHSTMLGQQNLCKKAVEFLNGMKNIAEYSRLEIISISTHMENGKIILKTLTRPYSENFNFVRFFQLVGDPLVEDLYKEEVTTSGNLLIPDEIKNFSYSEKDIENHDINFAKQSEIYNSCSKEKPFLNSIENYTPHKLPTPSDDMDLIYDLKTSDMKIQTISSYEQFTKVFTEVMRYVNGVEYYSYVNVMKGDKTEQSFMQDVEQYVIDTYIRTNMFPKEDLRTLMEKLYRALFQLYVVQDLIDDPLVTDVKITAPDAIRARVKGKAYMSNITFIDRDDYLRFVNGIAIRNNIKTTVPEQTFTDRSDKNYILRMSITAEYVNSVDWPYLHIRKVDRNKLMDKELLGAGMFDEKIRDYLLDCGKTSRGVVFAGRPGSGKTVCLNWFLERAYEQSAEILVIQENDELFCYRKGVMFQHVVNYSKGEEQSVTLEELGKLALVAGANVFVIGEAKGAEICSAITLSNSGCRTAITIHSSSSTETIDKMADLAMRGYAQDIDQAKRMLRSFQTIVYLEDFAVKEISEITGYDEETHDMTYKYIYRREA